MRSVIGFVVLYAVAFTTACGGDDQPSEPFRVEPGTWQSRATAPEILAGHSAAATGDVITVAGRTASDHLSARVHLYRPATNAWKRGPDLPEPRYSLAMAAIGGDVYAVGGLYGYDSHDVTTAWVLRSAANEWATIAELPEFATGPAASLGGKFYVISRASSRLLEYDPVSDAWTKRAMLPTARYFAALVSVDGMLVAIGGRTADYTSKPSGLVDVYDPKTDAWSPGPPMPTARNTAAIALSAREIYAIGGSGAYNTPPIDVVEILDAESHTWTSGPALPVPRSGAAVVVLDSTIFVIGGEESYDRVMTDTVLSFAPESPR